MLEWGCDLGEPTGGEKNYSSPKSVTYFCILLFGLLGMVNFSPLPISGVTYRARIHFLSDTPNNLAISVMLLGGWQN